MLNILKNSHLITKLSSTTFKKLIELRNKHEGESCYIFGNGPSIKWLDLSKFNDKPAITSGQLHYHREFKELDVRYLCLVEPWFFTSPYFRRPFITKGHSKIIEDHKKIRNDYTQLVKNSSDKTFFVNLSNFFHLRGDNVNYVFKTLPYDLELELLKGYDLFSGSFFATLSLAYYLGFKKVFMVGFDAWTLEPAMNKRYYEFGSGVPSGQAPEREPLLEIFKSLMDISVISHKSSSPVLNYIDFEQFYKIKAIYRENHEIIPKHYLEMMNACPGYEIYDH